MGRIGALSITGPQKKGAPMMAPTFGGDGGGGAAVAAPPESGLPGAEAAATGGTAPLPSLPTRAAPPAAKPSVPGAPAAGGAQGAGRIERTNAMQFSVQKGNLPALPSFGRPPGGK